MGLLDIFKNNKNQNAERVDNYTQNELPFDIRFNQIPNGNMQVELFNKNSNYDKFYDTTRLIIDRVPLNIEGHQVYNCAVSWYGHDDCQMLNEKTRQLDSLRAQEYRGVLIELDLELLQTDPNYCNVLMNGLLDKERVERYLEKGLEETPDLPCGKYIGGVSKTEKGYGKFFSRDVGMSSHYSDLMVNRRRRKIEENERQRQAEIESKKNQIKKLQSEIDDMER